VTAKAEKLPLIKKAGLRPLRPLGDLQSYVGYAADLVCVAAFR
jgi:hypothetical protein